MSVVIVITAALLLVDNGLGISFHYCVTNKMEELSKVNLIIQNPLSDSTTKAYAISLRQRILTRKNWIDYFSLRQSSNIVKNAQTNEPPNSATAKDSIKDDFWFVGSSIGFFVIASLVFLFMFIFYITEAGSLFVRLASGILYSFIFLTGAAIVFLITRNIPIIKHNWNFNYLLNLIIQCGVMSVILLVAFLYHSQRREKISKQMEKIKKDYKSTQTYPLDFYS